jgi:hypothetical protein
MEDGLWDNCMEASMRACRERNRQILQLRSKGVPVPEVALMQPPCHACQQA